MTFRPVVTVDPSLLEEGSFTRRVLEGIHYMDETLGMPTWNTRYVGLGTVLFLGSLRYTSIHGTYGVRWFSLVHSLIAGGLSFLAVWVSVFGAETLTGTDEPLRSLQCEGPLTSLHRILPAVTMGFGIIDVFEGLTLKLEFLMHGLATFGVMAYATEFGIQQFLAPMLLMEISTIPLNLLPATFLSEKSTLLLMVAFAVSFFVVRIIICPYMMWETFTHQLRMMNDDHPQDCIPWHGVYFLFMCSIFFNALNLYWGYKIVQKIQRKLKGKEKIQHQLKFTEQHDGDDDDGKGKKAQ